MIEDSTESMMKFLKSLIPTDIVELQAVSVAPFFDNKIERAIKRFDPDLIILDLLLVREAESGFRVLRRLKDSVLLKDVPVVVCSKYIGSDPDDRNKSKAMKLGAVAAIPKIPFPGVQDFLQYARKRD